MKFIIKNPAPLDANQEKWGDFHFGRSLTKYLERLGAEVETHYRPEWSSPNEADVVLVLRGKYRYRPQRGTLNVMWCMSNPSTVTVGECDEYDFVCVASTTHAAKLAAQTSTEVHPLMQCTDPEQFELGPRSDSSRRGYVFVGNSRGVPRDSVTWSLDFGLDLKIYGRGWRDFGLQGHVVANYIENLELPRLYATSRLTVNDHWNDMRGLGYVNNRTFDCLAAGLPFVCDDFPELRAIADDAIPLYRDRATFEAALTRALLAPDAVAKDQRDLWERIRGDYSFESRAEFLLDLASSGEASHRSRSSNGAGLPVDAIPDTNPRSDRDPFRAAQLEHIERALADGRSGRYCPCCGTESEAFRPGGTGTPRKDAKCPRCGALERHRLFWMYLVNDLWPKLPPGTKQLLHIAPEAHLGSLLHEKEDINYLSGDLFMPNAMVKLDLTDIQFPDDRFHVILCSHILEHIPDDRLAMRELFRVTKPGTYTIVQVPVYGATTYEDFSITDPAGRLEHFGQDDHVRKYGRDITSRLSSVGFTVKPLRVARDYPDSLARYLGLKDQLIFECHKPSPEHDETDD